MSHLNLIKRIGFRRIGEWHQRGDGISFEIETEAKIKKWVLYAFVCGKRVFYIGKATALFGSRLYGYKRPGKSQKTNTRVNPKISNLLRSNKRVLIYLFEGKQGLKFKGVDLNLSAALEDSLIDRISPEWNLNGLAKRSSISKR